MYLISIIDRIKNNIKQFWVEKGKRKYILCGLRGKISLSHIMLDYMKVLRYKKFICGGA